jgi:putative addiction module killer protein
MKYTISTTNIFDSWLASVKSVQHRARIISRFDKVAMGHFGDHKPVNKGVSELRFFFGPGYRVYYTIRGEQIVLLLSGGDKSSKSSQSKDIKLAQQILNELE